jgi:hypothetical protein
MSTYTVRAEIEITTGVSRCPYCGLPRGWSYELRRDVCKTPACAGNGR